MRCVNCASACARMRRHSISSLSVNLQSVLSEWLAVQLPQDGIVCHPCFILLNEKSAGSRRRLGHIIVCLGCGRSLLGLRSHTLDPNSPLFLIFSSWNAEHQTSGWRNNLLSCHACWTRAERHLQRNVPVTTKVEPLKLLIKVEDAQNNIEQHQPHDIEPLAAVKQPDEEQNIPEPPVLPVQHEPDIRVNIATIVLPNYKRAANTSRHCIFKGCIIKSGHLIPVFIKSMLIKKYKYYVPIHARVCEVHLYSNEWHLLHEISNCGNNFTSNQIEDLIAITTRDTDCFDFENVDEMPNHICHYWTGLHVDEFLNVFNEVPALKSIVSPRTSLAIYLIKNKTGDSDRRLSSLFNMPRSSLELHMKRVRDCLTEKFVSLQSV